MKKIHYAMWSSEFMLSKAKSAEYLHVDFTFKLIPSLFKQLLIITAREFPTGEIIPVFFALCNTKK